MNMTDRQKRLIRLIACIAGIMMTFKAMPSDGVEWVQNIGGWMMLILSAVYSNSDALIPKTKK